MKRENRRTVSQSRRLLRSKTFLYVLQMYNVVDRFLVIAYANGQAEIMPFMLFYFVQFFNHFYPCIYP